MTWLIKRNCSASPTQLAAVFGSLVAVSFAFGGVFAALGLWMVLPFVGLEVVAVGVAFLCCGRHAADVERIELANDKLTVERVEGDRSRRWEFDPRRVRVEVDERGKGLGVRVQVRLTSRGEELEVGRHLLDEKRAVLARELLTALRSAQT
ncbi:MAG: DUF2244 domain-containing protein [Burkholderiaceae bacterium]